MFTVSGWCGLENLKGSKGENKGNQSESSVIVGITRGLVAEVVVEERPAKCGDDEGDDAVKVTNGMSGCI